MSRRKEINPEDLINSRPKTFFELEQMKAENPIQRDKYLYKVVFMYDNGEEIVGERKYVICTYPLDKQDIVNTLNRYYKSPDDLLYDFQITPIRFFDKPSVLPG